jgi:mannosylfructose-phosphate synthase
MGSDMGEEELEERFRFQERIRKEFLVYRTCSHIIATTLPQTELLQTRYDVLERHVTVIPPGIDENRFSPVRREVKRELQKRYQLKPNDVLAVGRMAANKGHDLLIQALPTLLNLVPDARLIAAIGSDDSAQDESGIAELQSLADSLGIAGRIEWIKYISDEDLANYYRAATVFALSSRYEPFGMVAIEAMACGTPTVITVQGGLAEIVSFGTHALYADPNRPLEYGTILAMPMLYPNLAEELSVEGSRFARRNFGWTGIAKRILAIFDRARTVQIDQV